MRDLPANQFKGAPCRACGKSVRYIATAKCVACFRKQQKEHYHRPITDEQAAQIKELFIGGWSVFEICRRTHRGAEPVKALLVDQGLLPANVLGRTVSTCSRGKRALVYGGEGYTK